MSASDDRAARRRRNRADEKGQRAKEWEERDIERDWEISPEWKAYVTHVRTELVPMIEGSAMSISIVPKDPESVDVKFAVELGLCIMLDKPIILTVREDTLLSEHLRRVADEIIVGDPNDPGVREALMAAINRVDPRDDDE